MTPKKGLIYGIDYGDLRFSKRHELDKLAYEKYYDVTALDTRGKPLKIQPVTIEESRYFQLDRMFTDDPNAPLPSHVTTTTFDSDPEGLDALEMQGWTRA